MIESKLKAKNYNRGQHGVASYEEISWSTDHPYNH